MFPGCSAFFSSNLFLGILNISRVIIRYVYMNTYEDSNISVGLFTHLFGIYSRFYTAA
jgi:hypothetical protein